MIDFLPENFQCSDVVRNEALTKLAALYVLAEELPVYIIHDVRDFSVVYMSPKGVRPLGVTLEEIRKLGEAYFTRFFNADDAAFYVPKFKEHLRNPKATHWFSFLQQVSTGQGSLLEWYLSTSRTFVNDEEGKPLLSLTFALKMIPNHYLAEKADRLMAENLLLKDNYHRLASLTKRERQLLKHIAAGESVEETSCKLFISEKTLKTHRRNIKRKIGAKTHYDIIRFAQAFNLI